MVHELPALLGVPALPEKSPRRLRLKINPELLPKIRVMAEHIVSLAEELHREPCALSHYAVHRDDFPI